MLWWSNILRGTRHGPFFLFTGLPTMSWCSMFTIIWWLIKFLKHDVLPVPCLNLNFHAEMLGCAIAANLFFDLIASNFLFVLFWALSYWILIRTGDARSRNAGIERGQASTHPGMILKTQIVGWRWSLPDWDLDPQFSWRQFSGDEFVGAQGPSSSAGADLLGGLRKENFVPYGVDFGGAALKGQLIASITGLAN